MEEGRKPESAGKGEEAQAVEEQPAAPLAEKTPGQSSRVSRFWFTILLLFVFGVPALATWPISRHVPIGALLVTIILLGLIWVFALVLFGEYMSRGESAPLSTEVLVGAAAFFLLLAVLGLGPLRPVGFIWVSGFIITAGAVIRLYRQPTSPRHPMELFASLALMLVGWLLISITRFDYIFGIALVVILAVYWLVMAPPRGTSKTARKGPSL